MLAVFKSLIAYVQARKWDKNYNNKEWHLSYNNISRFASTVERNISKQ